MGIATLYAEDRLTIRSLSCPSRDGEAIEKFHRDTFSGGPLTCTPVNMIAEGEWVALEWTDPEGFRGSGFFHVVDELIVAQRGYWDSAALAKTHPSLPGHQ